MELRQALSAILALPLINAVSLGVAWARQGKVGAARPTSPPERTAAFPISAYL